MKAFRIFKRGEVYYVEDTKSKKQKSLRTRKREEAERLVFHKSESQIQPHLNLQIARTYLSAVDPKLIKRTWHDVMLQLEKCGGLNTQKRSQWATKSKAFDCIRNKTLVETTSDDFLKILEIAGPSVNHFLRRFHNLALGLGWLPSPILPKKFWPPIKYSKKRPITYEEHQRIIAREPNKERRLFYEFLWETGSSQSDAARLTTESIDWNQRLIIIYRMKLEHLDPVPAQIKIGRNLERILKELPQQGFLFPYLKDIDCKHRATEFHQRCEGLRIQGVSLHSYRYSWAVRAAEAGMPERFAQGNLGHGSKAIHRAYSRMAQIITPSLEECQQAREKLNIIPGNFQKEKIKVRA